MLKVKKMPLAQRLNAMEQLWESFSPEPEKLPSPQWHKEVLAQRRQEINQGTAQFISLAQLRKRLSK
jgi:hypothetical protein